MILIGIFGSSNSLSVLPSLQNNRIPLIGTYSGAMFLRKPFFPYIVNLRPAYYDEMSALVDYLINIKIARKISVFYQNDHFGLSCLEGVQRALAFLDLELCSSGSYERNTDDVENAFIEISKCKPDAVVVASLYSPATKFIRMVYNSSLFRSDVIIAASSVASDLIVNQLEPVLASRVIFTQIVPHNLNYSIVRSFQKSFREMGMNETQLSHAHIEGYLNGKFTYSILQRIIGNLTRSNFIQTLYYSKEVVFDNLKLGPYESCQPQDEGLSLNPSNETCNCNQGSRKIWRTKFDSQTKTWIEESTFSWKDCLTDSKSIEQPILLGQLEYSGRASSNELFSTGLRNGINYPLQLLTFKYSDLNSLIEKTLDLVENYKVFALVGFTGLSDVIGRNDEKLNKLTQFFKNIIPTVPLIGPVTTDFKIMGSSASNFIDSIINIRNSYIEEIGSLLDYAYMQGFTRFSFVYSSSYNHVYEYLDFFLKNVGLSLESVHQCGDDIQFSRIINPQVLFIACPVDRITNTVQILDRSASFRDEGLFIVLEEAKDVISNNQFQHRVIYSTPFPSTNSSSRIVSLFRTSLNNLGNFSLSHYLESDDALEGFYVGKFISTIIDALNYEPSLNFLQYIYSTNQIVFSDQQLGLFLQTSNLKCNIGIRQRYIYTMHRGMKYQNYIVNFPPNQCGLQEIVEKPYSILYKRPLQFIQLRRSKNNPTETLLVEYGQTDSVSKGILSLFNLLNENQKYQHYRFLLLTQFYNDQTNLTFLLDELIEKQKVSAFIVPDVNGLNAIEFKKIVDSTQVPTIAPLSGSIIFRDFSRNIINLFPSILDEIFVLTNFFHTNFQKQHILILYQEDEYEWSNPTLHSTIISIAEGKTYLITMKPIESISIVSEDYQSALILLADVDVVVKFLSRFIWKLKNNPQLLIGVTSQVYNDEDFFQSILSNEISSINLFTVLITEPYYFGNATSIPNSYIVYQFSNIFRKYYANDNYGHNGALNGFIIASFMDKVYESLFGKMTYNLQEFVQQVYSLSSFDLGDLRIGPFLDCKTSVVSCVKCNQGMHDMYVGQLSDKMSTTKVSNYNLHIETCGIMKDESNNVDWKKYYPYIALSLSLVFVFILLLLPFIIVKYLKHMKYLKTVPRSGKIVFAFTDIQNSTTLWQINEKAMKAALSIHNKIIRENIKKFKGYEVKTVSIYFY